MDQLWTALFCTIHLVLGFLAGRAARGQDSDVRVPARLAPALAQFQHSAGALQPALTYLPEEFQAAFKDLQQSVAMLASELTKRKPTPESSDPTPRTVADPPPQFHRHKNSSDKRSAERLGYSVPEFMTLFDGELQSIGDFEQVQCHDLSATGVSFFLDRHLDAGTACSSHLANKNKAGQLWRPKSSTPGQSSFVVRTGIASAASFCGG